MIRNKKYVELLKQFKIPFPPRCRIVKNCWGEAWHIVDENKLIVREDQPAFFFSIAEAEIWAVANGVKFEEGPSSLPTGFLASGTSIPEWGSGLC